MLSRSAIAVPQAPGSDLHGFLEALRDGGLRSALLFLNKRTPHRYTGVFRFDADMLRNVALVDKWDPAVIRGEDVPLAAAYCAHLHRTGEPLEVHDGNSDARVPWMAGNPIVSYCGAVVEDEFGRPWGALCHFDSAPCDAKTSDLPFILAAAKMLYEPAQAAGSCSSQGLA